MVVKIDKDYMVEYDFSVKICTIYFEYNNHKFKIDALVGKEDRSYLFKIYELCSDVNDKDSYKIKELYDFTIPKNILLTVTDEIGLGKLMYDYGSGYINNFFNFGMPHSTYVDFEFM